MATGCLFALVSAFCQSFMDWESTKFDSNNRPTCIFSKEATAQLKQTSGKDQNNLFKLTPAKFVLILIGLSFIFQLFRWTSPRRQHAPRDWYEFIWRLRHTETTPRPPALVPNLKAKSEKAKPNSNLSLKRELVFKITWLQPRNPALGLWLNKKLRSSKTVLLCYC